MMDGLTASYNAKSRVRRLMTLRHMTPTVPVTFAIKGWWR